MNKPNKRGGARPGAGRKPKDDTKAATFANVMLILRNMSTRLSTIEAILTTPKTQAPPTFSPSAEFNVLTLSDRVENIKYFLFYPKKYSKREHYPFSLKKEIDGGRFTTLYTHPDIITFTRGVKSCLVGFKQSQIKDTIAGEILKIYRNRLNEQ